MDQLQHKRAHVASAQLDGEYRGASGEVDLDDTGDVKGDFAVYRIDHGRVVDVPDN